MTADRWLALARSAGVSRRDLERYIDFELLDMAPELGDVMEERLRRIRRLQRQLDLPLPAIEVILRLHDQLARSGVVTRTSHVTVRVVEE